MPSTYSPSLKIQLIGTGEQAGTWGTTTNYNLGTLLEQAITGVVTIPMGDATYTLTNFNGLSDEARNAVLVLQGPITAPQAVIMPPQQKVYIVRNRTGNSVTLSANVGGVNVSIANAASEVVFCDGSNVYSATQFNYIDGNLTVSNDLFVNGNAAISGEVVLSSDVFGNVNTGQWYLPTGNTAQRSVSGRVGLIRYNSELDIYEGFSNSVWVRFQTYPQGNYTVQYLVAAGGGGGGGGVSSANVPSGAGGAGGVLTGSTVFDAGTTYTIIIGAGGGVQTQGSTSYLAAPGPIYIANCVGGGFGGPNYDDFRDSGGNGGSGGGQGRGASGGASAGTGTAGQGNNGGGFGGGGAGAIGTSSAGGVGLFSGISGTGAYYGGGGGGGAAGQPGGAGGGGQSGNSFGGPGPTGISGGVNTGGGGGGNGGYTNSGGAGGSGICIIAVPTVNYSGTYTGTPVITTSGANTILTFNAAGTYTA